MIGPAIDLPLRAENWSRGENQTEFVEDQEGLKQSFNTLDDGRRAHTKAGLFSLPHTAAHRPNGGEGGWAWTGKEGGREASEGRREGGPVPKREMDKSERSWGAHGAESAMDSESNASGASVHCTR